MSNTTSAWLHGIGAAFVGGFSSAMVAWLAAPQAFNFSHDGLVAFAKVIIVGSLLPTFAYLKQSPLPSASATVTSSETVAVTKN